MPIPDTYQDLHRCLLQVQSIVSVVNKLVAFSIATLGYFELPFWNVQSGTANGIQVYNFDNFR